ncbi:MAG: hypothetical protein EXR62_11535 [Chloroflexi bacterium]|nr:hypothetical protein [Chloroflexota bacterium]
MSNKPSKNQSVNTEEELPEYDFSGGVRGKYYQAYQQGHKLVIHQADGTTMVQDFPLPEGAVILDPDVRAYFPDSETVNSVLRALINLIPARHEGSKNT